MNSFVLILWIENNIDLLKVRKSQKEIVVSSSISKKQKLICLFLLDHFRPSGQKSRKNSWFFGICENTTI
jgi:hypothetical protein